MDIFSQKDNRLYSLIDLVRTNPTMYLGEKSITLFSAQLTGYIWACEDYKINDISFVPLDIFRSWLAIKYDNQMTVSAKTIILMSHGYDDAKALDVFFSDWGEFLAQDHEMLKRDFISEDGQLIYYPDKYWPVSHQYSIYILTEMRKAKHLKEFLDHKIQGKLEPTLFFPYGTYIYKMGEHEIIFNNTDEVLNYFEKNEESFELYFSNNDYSDCSQGLRKVMLFFTEDGHIIIGIDVAIRGPKMANMEFSRDIRIDGWANTLKQYFNSNLILYAYETPPPQNKTEFINAIETRVFDVNQ